MIKTITTLFIGILFTSFSSLCWANEPLEIESKIDKVTVYISNASITRNVDFNVNEGINTIHFTKLSKSLLDNTIRFNTKGVRVLSIDTKSKFLSIKDNEAYKKLKEKHDAILDKINDKKAYLAILAKDLEVLDANKQINSQGLNTTDLKNTIQFFHDKRVAVEKEKKSNLLEIEAFKKEESLLLKEIRDLENKHQGFYKEVIVSIQSDKTQSLKGTLKYNVSNVGWSPSYDVFAKDINSPLQVIFKANIYQNSGIDWKNVTLNIASGNPTLDNNIPQLPPNYLNLSPIENNVRSIALQGKMPGIQTSKSKIQNDELEEEIKIEYSSWDLETVSYQTQFVYNIPQKYSIKNGTNQKEISLKNEEVKAEYVYKTIPKLNTNVFLMGNIPDFGTYNLLAGNANIYFEGQFVGETFLSSDQSTDTLSISLGIDESIVVERKRAYQMEKKKSFGSKKRENRAWEISVKNNKSTPISIEVVDQLPLSVNDQITVTPIEISKGKVNKDTGAILWKMEIAAQQTQKRIVQYEVEYPSKGYERLDID